MTENKEVRVTMKNPMDRDFPSLLEYMEDHQDFFEQAITDYHKKLFHILETHGADDQNIDSFVVERNHDVRKLMETRVFKDSVLIGRITFKTGLEDGTV